MCHRSSNDNDDETRQKDPSKEEFTQYSEEPLPESFRPRRDGPGGD